MAGDPYLKHVVTEVMDCAEEYPNRLVFPSPEASRYPTLADFNLHASKADILHIACHGRLMVDPLKSGFQVSGPVGGIAWVTGNDVLKLDLKTRVVVANLCHAAAGQLGNGDEWLGLL